jgi:hypothetical protein
MFDSRHLDTLDASVGLQCYREFALSMALLSEYGVGIGHSGMGF